MSDDNSQNRGLAALPGDTDILDLITGDYPEGVLILDVQMRALYVNDVATRAMGPANTEHLRTRGSGDRLKQYAIVDAFGRKVRPEDLPSRVAVQTRRPIRRILGWADPVGGERRWTIVTAKPVFGDDGAVRVVVVSTTDATDLLDTNATLEISEKRLQQAQRLARIGHYEFSLLGDEVVWGETTYDIVDRDPELGPPSVDEYYRLVHPDDLPRMQSELVEAITLGNPFDLEYRIVTRDGSVRHIHSVGETIADETGRPVRVFGTIKDITRLREQEQAARVQEDRFRAIADHTADWESWLAPDGGLLWVNPAVERMTGYTVADCEAMDEYPMPIVHPDERDLMRSLIREALADKASGNDLEFRFIRKGGGILWGAISWVPIFDAVGNALGVRASVRDINRRKVVERERDRMFGTLIEARKTEALAVLAGGLAHEFNNLHTAISGFTEFLLQGNALDPEQREDLKQILHASTRASDLVQKMLAYSRRQTIAPERVVLGRLLDGIRSIVAHRVPPSILLTWDWKPGEIAVFADPHQLEHTLIDLLTNAFEALPQGGAVRVSVTADEAAPVTHDGQILPRRRYAVVRVEDTGPGVPVELRSRIFDPFFTTKNRALHTGLSLAAADGAARQNKGVLTVGESPDGGAVFSLYLPALE